MGLQQTARRCHNNYLLPCDGRQNRAERPPPLPRIPSCSSRPLGAPEVENEAIVYNDNNVDEETVEDSITNVVADNESRELLTYPRECEKLCSTYPSGRCMALKCLGFRNRMLQYNSCGTQMIAFRNLVKTIASIPELGVDCKALLKAPALMTCVNYPC